MLHKASKTLIAGDTMNIKNGQLTGNNTQIMNEEEEIKKAINSPKKLMEYDVENVITYHRGLFNNNLKKED
ncbi:MAG TPA: hypothetical protein VHO92_06365 [Methanobacterium sp.]|nr:hypothetical protein [Methanobacterium sp.]